MISGCVTNHLLLILLFFCISLQPAYADELEHLMQAMSEVKHRIVRYREVKQMDLLEALLTSEGTLEYIAPDKLIRSVQKPAQVRYIIDSRQVSIEKGDKLQTRDLDEVPMVRIFIESFRAVLAGDLPSLEQHYAIVFNGDRYKWEIVLRPKDKKLSSYVDRLQLSGTGDTIELYIIEDSNGDLTRMQLFSGKEDKSYKAETGE